MSPTFASRGIPDLVPGDHLCCLYETEEEHRAVLTPFLRQGLERGEKVLYFVDARTAQAVLAYLREDGLEVEPYLARGQLCILTRDDAYMRQGVFDPDGMIALLRSETARALAEGYPALRTSGEMTRALRGLPGFGRLIEYEAKLNNFFRGSQCLGLCQYDRRRFDPAVLLEVLATHPTAVVGMAVYDNFYYLPPQEILGDDRPAATLRHWLENLAARKRTEENLRESEERSRIIARATNDAVWDWDLVRNVVWWNEGVRALFGYTAGEVGGDVTWWYEHIHPEERERVVSGIHAVISAAGQFWSDEYRYRRADGSYACVFGRGLIMHDDKGKPVRMIGAMVDITERKKAEEERKESEQRFRRLSEATFEAVVIHDEGKILDANQTFAKMFGYELSEVIGKNALDFTAPESRDLVLKNILSEYEKPYEVIALRKDGSTFVQETRGRAIPYEGRIVRVAAIRDITERKRAEAALLDRTRQLEAVRVVNEEITRELGLTPVLQLILQRAMELVEVSSGGISLWDETAQVLVPQAWRGLGARIGEVYIRLGEGVAGVVAERREGMIVNDYQTSPHALPDVLECSEIAAILAEPLMCGERLVGVLILFNMETERSFSEQDRQTLALFATQAAIAIENARLYGAAARRAEELGALLRTTHSVMAGLDLQSTLGRILTEAAQIARTPHVKVLLVDRERQTVRLEAAAGRPPEMLADFHMPLGTGLSGIVAAAGQPLVVQDCHADPRNIGADQDRQLGLRTYLGLPIKIKGETLGVLTFNLTYPYRYTDEELAYLGAFADQVAIAIENAQLFDGVRTGRERLQSLSHRLVEVQEAERRGIARELHDEIGQLLTGLKLLLEMSARVRPEKVKARLSEAQALANELMARVRELSLDLRPAMLDDLGLLPALLWHFERYTARTNVRVDFEHSGLERRFLSEVETAAYRIVQEALNNVARHAKVAEVAVRLWADENALDLRIEDRGAGFDAEATLSAAASSGLAGMHERAALLGGRLTVTSTPGSGTQVLAELPLTGRFEKRRKPR